MSNRIFAFVAVLLYMCGGAIAYRLGSIQQLEIFKILNIVGIIYSLIGVLVLSEFVAQNERWRRFVVDKLSGVMIWAHGIIPFGAATTSLVLFVVAKSEFPSSGVVGTSFMAFALYALIPTFIVEDLVFVPKSARFKDTVLRTRIFGLFLVASGLTVQLIAAIQEVLGRGGQA